MRLISLDTCSPTGRAMTSMDDGDVTRIQTHRHRAQIPTLPLLFMRPSLILVM